MNRDNVLARLDELREQIDQLDREVRTGAENQPTVQEADFSFVPQMPRDPASPNPLQTPPGADDSVGDTTIPTMPKPDALPNSTDERGPSALGAFPPQHQWSDEEANRLSNPFETTSISLFVEEPTVIDDPDASVSDVAASMVEHDTDVLVLATDDGHRLITLQTIVQQVADGGEGRAGEFAREAPNVQIAASFEELLAALTDADIEAAVVVDGEGELRGVVRVSNVAKHLARAVGVPELTPALSGQPY